MPGGLEALPTLEPLHNVLCVMPDAVGPHHAAFGLSLFSKSSNQARADLLGKGLPGLVTMLVGLAPTFGDYYDVPGSEVGTLRKPRPQQESLQSQPRQQLQG